MPWPAFRRLFSFAAVLHARESRSLNSGAKVFARMGRGKINSSTSHILRQAQIFEECLPELSHLVSATFGRHDAVLVPETGLAM